MVAPANDLWANAAPVALTGGLFDSGVIDSTDATLETGEPRSISGKQSVWFVYTPAADNTITLDLAQSFGDTYNDTLMGIYTGTAVDALTEVAYNDDADSATNKFYSRIANFAATAGTTYYFRVAQYVNDAPVQYHLTVTDPTYTGGAGTPSTGTDTSLGSNGYSYTGRGALDYDPPVTPDPAHARRAPVKWIHQSLPAPTLVDGRPT